MVFDLFPNFRYIYFKCHNFGQKKCILKSVQVYYNNVIMFNDTQIGMLMNQ